LKAQLSQKEILLQNKIIKHQMILTMLKKQELSVEQSKLDKLLFDKYQEILTYNISSK